MVPESVPTAEQVYDFKMSKTENSPYQQARRDELENYFNHKSSDQVKPATLSDEDYQKSIESLSMPAPVWVEIPLEDPHYDSMPAPKIVEIPLIDPKSSDEEIPLSE